VPVRAPRDDEPLRPARSERPDSVAAFEVGTPRLRGSRVDAPISDRSRDEQLDVEREVRQPSGPRSLLHLVDDLETDALDQVDGPCADFWYVEEGKIKQFDCYVSCMTRRWIAR